MTIQSFASADDPPGLRNLGDKDLNGPDLLHSRHAHYVGGVIEEPRPSLANMASSERLIVYQARTTRR